MRAMSSRNSPYKANSEQRGSMTSSLTSRWYLLVAPVLVAGTLSMTAVAGTSGVGERIYRAVRAPYEALGHRDASAFCADFTPAVAAKIVPEAPANSTCPEAVAEVFAQTASYEPPFPLPLPVGWRVTRIVLHGDHASAVLSFGKQGSASFALRRISARWRIATRARLVTVAGCHGEFGAKDCPPGARVLIAIIGLVNPQAPTPVPVPESVKRVGGAELKEFKKGRTVCAQSGCDACHRIGSRGNPGPGPSLAHVGSKLSMRRIEHALVDPSEPMPSFKNLPPTKFHALVRFLSLLR